MFKQLNPILPVKEILKEINGLADEIAGLSNLELKNKTRNFRSVWPKEKAWMTFFQKLLRLFVKRISAC